MDMSRIGSEGRRGRVELDSHADTCVAGANFQLVETTGEYAIVHPYSDGYEPVKVPIATVETAYTSPITGETVILVGHQHLYFGDKMDHSLLNPNQLRHAGATVWDCPKQFNLDSEFCIRLEDDEGEPFVIPLELHGVIQYLECHIPTDEENMRCRRIEYTSDAPWDPYSTDFEENERAATSFDEYRVSEIRSRRQEIAVVDFEQSGTLYERLVSAVQVELQKAALSQASPDEQDHDTPLESDGVMNDFARYAKAVETLRKPVVDEQLLSRRWGIGVETARRTIKGTTQVGIRTRNLPMERRIRTRRANMRFPTIKRPIYSDTAFLQVKSVRLNTCAQLYTDCLGYDHFYPMRKRSEAGYSLESFVQDNQWIPRTIVTDGAMEQQGGDWKTACKKWQIQQRYTEPYSPWQNSAEKTVMEVKKMIKRQTIRTGSPKRLWCYLGEWCAAIRRHTAHDYPGLDGQIPEARYSGYDDISEWASFGWYDLVWYMDPRSERKLGRWIGVASSVGDPMVFSIITEKARVVPRSSVQHVLPEEFETDGFKKLKKELDDGINSRIGDHLRNDSLLPELGDLPDVDDGPWDVDDEVVEPLEKEATMPEADEHEDPVVFDKYIGAEILLNRGGEQVAGRVVSRKRDADDKPIGYAHSNPLLDTREYQVEFVDGSTEAYTTNLIAEAMYSQVDDEGRNLTLLKEIVDHRKDATAVEAADAFGRTRSGRKFRRRTTKGWELCALFKNGQTAFLPLKDLRESYPLQVAEYAVANKIDNEPAFAWWVPYVLRKRDRILSKVKSRKYWVRTHKFGIRLPKTVEEALQIDEETGTDFWRKAIEKEMKNVMPAFHFPEDGKAPVGYKPITVHMVFDLKMDLTRKARLVADGHKTEVPAESVYSSVVSKDSVRLLLLIAALNDLDVLSADVQNAYLQAPTKEKLYIEKAGLEFGASRKDQLVLIVRALYGLRSSGARWHDEFARTLRENGFQRSKGDPDVWMRAAMKPDGFKYWEYIAVYVDDILAISHMPKAIMDSLEKSYTLKEGSVTEPEVYLGASIVKWTIDGSDDPTKVRWGMSAKRYIKLSLLDVEATLKAAGQKLPGKAPSPYSYAKYRPELDDSDELDPARASYYQGLIGILRWCIELGRVDIMLEVTELASFTTAPRKGHLDQAIHIFAYLKKHEQSTMVFDDTEPDLKGFEFKECDWSEAYHGAKEAIPLDVPEQRGNSVVTTCYVDADHAGDRLTRRSHTGVYIFVNRAPIIWFSKKQRTVESSTFGSEFVAMRTAVDLVEALRYKLRMFGVPIDGPTAMLCDNDAVVRNTTAPESTLKKKHNAINFHRCREAVAAGMIRVAKVFTGMNLADTATKVLPGPLRRRLFRMILW